MTNVEPVNDVAKNSVITLIRASAPEARTAGWPGMPKTQLPLSLRDNLRALIADGVVNRLTVTTPSKIDPSTMVTYTFLALDNDRARSRRIGIAESDQDGDPSSVEDREEF